VALTLRKDEQQLEQYAMHISAADDGTTCTKSLNSIELISPDNIGEKNDKNHSGFLAR